MTRIWRIGADLFFQFLSSVFIRAISVIRVLFFERGLGGFAWILFWIGLICGHLLNLRYLRAIFGTRMTRIWRIGADLFFQFLSSVFIPTICVIRVLFLNMD